jgi:hypothetical protein
MDRPYNNTVIIDGIVYPVERDVSINHQATFPDRQTFGDPTARDQEYLSNWAIRKVPGGLGVEEYDEGTDAERLWWACMDTRYGRGWTLPPLVTATRPDGVPDDAISYPLGVIGTQAYTCFSYDDGGAVYEVYGWDQDDSVWHVTANALTAAPVNKPVTFAGTGTARVFVPLGAAGYVVLEEDDPSIGDLDITTVTGGSDPDAVAMCVWQTGAIAWLAAIDTSGYLFYSATTGLTGTWVQPDDGLPSSPNTVKIDSSETVKHLVVYQAPDRTSTLHAITTRGIWIYNHDVPVFERLHFQMAPHPDNALGAAVWRPGENLHITQGLERWQYTTAGSEVVIPNTGPVKDDGVPARFRGKLTDLEAEASFLFAPLTGSNADTYIDEFVEDGGTHRDDPLYVSPNEAFSALLCDTGLGWHCLWESPEPTNLTWAKVAGISPGYALWFGGDKGDVYRLPLRAPFHNAQQGALLGVDTFAEEGYFITGWFDAAMINFDKLLHSLSVTMSSATATEYIDFSYQVDHDEVNWVPLGRVSSSGKTELDFGVDDDGVSRGIAVNRIRFMGQARRGSTTNLSPVFTALALHFIKIAHDAKVFSLQIDFARENWAGISADEMRDNFTNLLVSRRFIVLEHARGRHLALLTRLGGSDATGRDESGSRTLSFLALEDLGAA